MSIITPYGDRKLVNLVVTPDARNDLKKKVEFLKSIPLSPRSLCDLELLATGGFSPLENFMGEKDYNSILETSRLASGILFPIPITLPVSEKDDVQIGQEVVLVDQYNVPLAIMHVQEKYKWNREKEALAIFKSVDAKHPVIKEMETWGEYYISGKLQVFTLPTHPDFREFRYTPAEVRQLLEKINNPNVVAFQTRNPMHRAHEELTKRAMKELNAVLLLHPTVGLTKPHDVDYFTRVRIYEALLEKYYDKGQVILSLLPLAMRMAGPREALWHAIIRRNHGANHFIVGRDHAGPGNNSQGKPFFAPYEAQALAKQYEKELGITIVPFNEFVYLPEEHCYEDRAKLSPDKKFWTISGTQVREEYLDKAKPLPSWFTREECAQILAKAYPPKNQRGLCIWFTGLPCAGKTTHAEILAAKLRQAGKAVTFCDGDVMRKFLATGLGFSLEDRETYLRRLGYIAAEIVRHQGIIIVAAVSPLKHSRRYVREEINKSIGNFVEVFIDTPIEVCSRRDIKGMYAKAKRGEIPNFTGISSPYETPENPEIRLTTENISQEENVKTILQYLQEHDDLSLSCHIAPQVFV